MSETITMPMWTFWFIMSPWLFMGAMFVIALLMVLFGGLTGRDTLPTPSFDVRVVNHKEAADE